MRKILFLSLVLFIQLSLFAQDKIITQNGDTILCKIISVSDNRIIYEQKDDKSYISGKIISLDEVAEYYKESSTQLSKKMGFSRRPQKPWLLSLSFGGGHLPWLLENMPENSAEYSDYKKLDDGLSLNTSLHYFITKNIGFGVHYSFFKSQIKNNYLSEIESSYPIYSNSSFHECQYINYIGESVIFRQFLDRKNKFSFSETLSAGILIYRGESQNSIFLPNSSGYGYGGYGGYSDASQNILITGIAFGLSGGVSAEYKILPFMSVGIGGNFMFSKLTNASGEINNSYGSSNKYTNEKLDNPINLSRIDYSFVIRFHL